MSRLRWLTPPGVAAVAVVALDGTVGRPCPLTDARGGPLGWPARGRFRRAHLRMDGALLDDVLVLGTDLGAELHVHGGAGVAAAVEGCLAGCGFLPEPPRSGDPLATTRPPGGGGEGRPDGAGSLAQARALASERHGPLSSLREGGAGLLSTDDLRRAVSLLHRGRYLARAPRVRLVGGPNAGKSTLFNALLGEERALVSPVAGTTRDTIQALTRWDDVPVVLEDTAGGEPMAPGGPDVDLVLHLLERPGEPVLSWPPGVVLVRVPGKCDLRGGPGVSGLTGQGVDALRARLAAALGLPGSPRDDVWTPVDPTLRRRLRGDRAAGSR